MTERTTNLHAMRFDDDLWSDLKRQAATEGVTVNGITRDFYEWWLRRPGAKLPKRPEPKI